MKSIRFLLLLVCCNICLQISGKTAFIQTANSDFAVFYTSTQTPPSSELLKSFDERVYELQSDIGIYTDQAVPIFIVEDAATYTMISKNKDEIVEFSDAFYSSSEERIYIKSWAYINDNYLKVLVHEYIHWFLDQSFTRAPLWFHEGMATYYSHQLGLGRYLEFVRNSFWGNTHDLFRHGYSYPELASEWQGYYVSSYFALKWMKENHQGQWKHLWDNVASNHRKGYKTDFVQQFNSSYLITMWDFNSAFERYSKKQSYIYLILGLNSLIFALLPPIMVFASIRRKKRRDSLPDLPDLPEDLQIEEDDD